MRAILTYHSIDRSGSPISVAPEAFRRHVEWLAAGPVETVPLPELTERPAGSDAVAVTFDDAFANFLDEAWPLLRDNGIPVTLFVATGHVGRDNAWGGNRDPVVPRLPILGWDALGRLVEDGVTLGSHTVSHPDLTRLDDEALAAELTRSAEHIGERTGTRPSSAAYPFGRHSDRVVAAAARVYRYACTTELRPLRAVEHAWRLPRLDAYYYREGKRLATWGGWTFHAHLWLRAAARSAREAIAGRSRHAT